jgi:hydrogenase maturation protein HypF
MALEWLADPAVRDAYPFELMRMADNRRQTTSNRQNGHAPPSVGAEQPPMIIDWRPTLDVLLADLRRGVARGIIAARFHNAMVEAIVAVAVAVGEARVALSGGCFQNRILVERVARRLADAGFEVLLHRQVPTNDGGISFGQVAAAAAQLAR